MNTYLTDFVEGNFFEVLWDIERFCKEGRRKGERTVESVWWKGEVVEVTKDTGEVFVRVKYEALGGVKTQTGDLRVFPRHMMLMSERETTQLRWRFYESSGDVTYENAGIDGDEYHDVLGSAGSSHNVTNSLGLLPPQNTLNDVAGRVEKVERLLVAQRDVRFRFSNTRSDVERCSERLLALLRHKLAGIAQKPLVPYKQRKEKHDTGETLSDFSSAGFIRAHCTMEEFEIVSHAFRSVCASPCFRVVGCPFAPFAPCGGSLQASVGVAEILFYSLSDLCLALGISHERDLMNIARHERKEGKKSN